MPNSPMQQVIEQYRPLTGSIRQLNILLEQLLFNQGLWINFDDPNKFITHQQTMLEEQDTPTRVSRGLKKPIFLTKYRLRSNKKEQVDFSQDAHLSHSNNVNKMRPKTEVSEHSDIVKLAKFQETSKTSRKLEAINFDHHNTSQCLCDDCTCGRHLCQLNCIKPDLTKKTTYKSDFLRKKPIKNKINITTEYDRLKGPNLELNTVYFNDFKSKQIELNMSIPKPADSLKTQGPIMNLTSYFSNFPGHRGMNQYIKPTDKHIRGEFAMKSGTTYSKSYTGTPVKKREYERAPDNLKTGNTNWYGKTTYSKSFIAPNPEYFPPHYIHTEKAEQIPSYSQHQIQTIYRKNFIPHEPKSCPAKTKMDMKGNYYCKNKSKFNERANFKSMDFSFIPFSKKG